jgi:hypothetical protein
VRFSKRRFNKRIARKNSPTEIDSVIIQGYVHDMGAAMEGGITHAGIFSNSMDAK